MLYEDDDYMDDMGGMALGGMMHGGVGSVAASKVNPYIEFQKVMKAKGKTFASKEARSEAYQKWLKSAAYKKWAEKPTKKAKKAKEPKEPKPRKVRAVPQRVALNPKRYDVYDVRKRLFSKTAKHPLSQYTAEQQNKLNQDLVTLGSGVRGRKVNHCPHCGGAWYDTAWDVVKTAAPYIAPLLL